MKDTAITEEERTLLLQSIEQVENYYKKLEDSITQKHINDHEHFILSMGRAAQYYEKCYRQFINHYGCSERAIDLAEGIEKTYKKNFYHFRTFEKQFPLWSHERDSL